MDIQIVGRHLEITAAVRQYALAKVERLGKFFEGILWIKVNLSLSAGLYRTELICSVVRGQALIAHADGKDLYASIDSAVDKGERLLKKFKEKIKNKKVKEMPGEKPLAGSEETEVEEIEDVE